MLATSSLPDTSTTQPTISTSTWSSNFNENANQVASNIQQVQDARAELLQYLQTNQNALTEEQQQYLMNRVMELEAMRNNLAQTISNIMSTTQSQWQATQLQNDAVDVLNYGANYLKKMAHDRAQEDVEKIRQIQINTYYAKQYAAESELLKSVVLYSAILIGLTILTNVGLLPSIVYVCAMAVVIIYAYFVIFPQAVDISNRSNTNYDEYDWSFNKAKAMQQSEQQEAQRAMLASNPPTTTSYNVCIGASCCGPNQTFVGNKCV